MAIQTLYSDTKKVGTYTRARIVVQENSIDITNNSSNITVYVQMWRTNTGYTTSGIGTLTINIGGTSYNSSITTSQAITYNSYTTIGSPVTLNVSHNDNGTKTINISASSSTNNTNMTFSSFGNDFVLTTVPRSSNISCTSPYIGDTASVNIASASANFTHTVTYAFGSLTGTLYTKTSLTSFGWNTNSIKSQLYAQIPNAQSGIGTLTCYTYSGNTLVGSKTCNFNLYAKENECKPTVSATIVDTNSATIALTGDSSKIVKNISKPKVSISATFKNSASAAASNPYLISTGDGQSSNSQEYTFSNGINDSNIYVRAADTRGYYNVVGYNLSSSNKWVEYIKLAFTNVSISRPESTLSAATVNISGNYFNGSFGANNNGISLKYRYKESGGTYGDYTMITPTVTGNTFSYSATITNIDSGKSYVFEFVVADSLMIVSSGEKILEKGVPVFRIGKDYINVNGNLKADNSKVDLFKTQQVQIAFDVTNISVGSYVLNNIACPTITGYTPIGVLVEEMDYGDTNYIFSPNIRIGRIYAKLLLGYKGTATSIKVYLRVIYIRNT